MTAELKQVSMIPKLKHVKDAELKQVNIALAKPREKARSMCRLARWMCRLAQLHVHACMSRGARVGR